MPWRLARFFGLSRSAWGEAASLGLLLLLVLLSRLPFRSQMLFNWDAADFALGMRSYNVALFAPHPPGYLYYIGVAKLFQVFLGEENASLVAVSVLFSLLAVAVLYLLGRTLYDAPTAWVAGLLLAISVTFWTYGAVALSYVTLAFFSTLVAWLAFRTAFQGKGGYFWLTLCYGLTAGFRAELLLFLAPLWLMALKNLSWRLRLTHAGFAALLVLAWLLPTALLSGGLGTYFSLLRSYTQQDVLQPYSLLYRGGQGLMVNLRDTASYLFYALYAISLPTVLAGLWYLLRWRRWREDRMGFLLLWILPMVLFYLLIHVGDPGYVFGFYPALLLPVARFLTVVSLPGLSGPQRKLVLGALLTGLVALNTWIFLAHPRPLTARGIQEQDAFLSATISYLRATYAPEAVLLLASLSYRHLLFYLPEYPMAHWLNRHDPREREVAIPPGVEAVVLVDPDLEALLARGVTGERAGEGVPLRVLRVKEGQRLVYSGGGIAVR